MLKKTHLDVILEQSEESRLLYFQGLGDPSSPSAPRG